MRALALALFLLLGWTRHAAASPPCERKTFESAGFVVCTYEPGRHAIAIAWRTPEGQVLGGLAGLKGHLGPAWPRVQFAMNAGMFHFGGKPVGLFIQDGREETPLNQRSGPGNFHMKPNGVFWVGRSGRAGVDPTERFRTLKTQVRFASQSGPMLLIGGRLHPGIQNDGPSRLLRNGVGALPDGRAAFVMSEGPVSFGKMARFFRDGLAVKNALYLDGSVSSLAVPAWNRLDVRAPLGPVLWVSARD